jgi:hypothetical protein
MPIAVHTLRMLAQYPDAMTAEDEEGVRYLKDKAGKIIAYFRTDYWLAWEVYDPNESKPSPLLVPVPKLGQAG